MKHNEIYPNVKFNDDANIEDYSVIGVPQTGRIDSEVKTIIGKNPLIRSHTIIYAGNIIGDNFQTGHRVFIRENNRIGDNVSIGTGTNIEYEVIIEDNVRIHSQSFVSEYSILREGCWIGPNVVLTNAKYPQSKGVKNRINGPEIKSKAKVGANSTILPGVVIGENSLVGAGSVVTKDVESNAVVAGNPAKFVKKIDDIKYY